MTTLCGTNSQNQPVAYNALISKDIANRLRFDPTKDNSLFLILSKS